MINLVRRVRINDRIPAMWYNDKLIRTAYRKETLIVGEYEYDPNPSPYATKYFCIESLEDSNTITFTKFNYYSTPSNTYYTSTDLVTWTEYYGTQSWTLNNGQKLYFKAIANSWGAAPDNNNAQRGWRFSSTKTCDVSGNIMSLLYGDDFAGQTELTSYINAGLYKYQFYALFMGCTNIVSVKNLVLPATTLAESCYEYMFAGCTSFTKAPALPATTLSKRCYAQMFSGCTSLTTAPSLNATTLAETCYYRMFYNCTSLVNVQASLPATILYLGCYTSMFMSCTSLTSAPALPATTLAESCYQSMFYGCSSLLTAPELPATKLVESCYHQMFDQCSSLNYIKCLATDISASYCVYYWVRYVASSGTFIKDASMSSWPSGISGIPSGWTVQNA